MKPYIKPDMKFKITPEGTISGTELSEMKFILYVYPKDNTSACTLEANEFADVYEAFKNLGYEIFGISKDTLSSHLKFKAKYELPFELISDTEKELLNALGVMKEKKMYGKTVMGTVRSTFVFDKGLKMIAEYRDIKAPGHAETVLEAVKAFSA
ncbi:peroxiredoxin [Fusibacter paucivorans]|uniref:thioredoxin-dependent peroxiredoxin n=1 Tax=Fusibacter paucivorans TaxID=76009 RepID=A0ABS5PQN5_9FIRM|nr:peroxiredoxin [Fusibacter paucivorans]MBS7527381.1 peroxiredoxin [Fusibacter paucivorans]